MKNLCPEQIIFPPCRIAGEGFAGISRARENSLDPEKKTGGNRAPLLFSIL